MYTTSIYNSAVLQEMTQKTTEEKSLILETHRSIRHAAGEAVLGWLQDNDDLELTEEYSEDFIRGYNQARSDAAQFALKNVLDTPDPFGEDEGGCDCK